MYGQCYLRTGVVYLPTTGVTKHRLYQSIEPVTVIPASNTEALQRALAEMITRGNPEIPALKPSDYPPPVLLKYAAVKSWGAFARSASLWAFEEAEKVLRIRPYRRDERSAFVPDKNSIITLPESSTPNDLIERLISILQEATKEQPKSK